MRRSRLLVSSAAALVVVWLAVTVLRQPHPDPGPHVAWWVLALLYAAVEIDRRGSRGGPRPVPAGRVVLVVGLALAAPVGLIVGQAVGLAAGSWSGFRRRPIRTLEHVATAVLATALGSWTYLELVERTDPVGPIGWFELAAAGLVVSISQGALARLAALRDPADATAGPWTTVLLADLLAIATGLVVVEILQTDPRAGWLLLLPAAAAWAVRHQYEMARWRGDALTVLHDTAREFHGADEVDDVARLAVDRCRNLFRAERVELVLRTDAGDLRRFVDDGSGTSVTVTDADPKRPEPPDADRSRRPLAVGRGPVVAAPVVVDGVEVGTLRVQRRPLARELAALERGVLDTLVAQLGGALESLRSLAEVAERHRQDAELLAGLDRVNTELRRVSEAKSVFLATTSHELRAPLTALLAETELLTDLVGDPGAVAVSRKLVAEAAGNARHLLRLVDDLLDLSRIEAGQLELRCAPVDLREVARSVVDSLRPVVADGGVTLRLLAPRPVPLSGDADRLWQLTANLVENARRATPVGGEITVSVAGAAQACELIVEDTGVGIGACELERIFGAFERTGSTRGGLGLGLTIARHLAERHGGTLAASSTVGVGSRFVARFPRGSSHPTSAAPLV